MQIDDDLIRNEFLAETKAVLENYESAIHSSRWSESRLTIIEALNTLKIIRESSGFLGLTLVNRELYAFERELPSKLLGQDATTSPQLRLWFLMMVRRMIDMIESHQNPSDEIIDSRTISLGETQAIKKLNRVLVVERSGVLKSIVVRALNQHETIESVTADDENQGWKCFERQRFDILLTGWCSANLSDLNLISRIRRMCPSFPIVLFTCDRNMEKHSLAKEIGVSDILPMPFSASDLVRVVQRNCGLKSPSPALCTAN